MSEGDERVLEAFRARFAYDRGLKRLKPVEHYQRLFPGFEQSISAEYARLAEVPPAAATTPDPRPAAPVPEPSAAPGTTTIGPYRLVREIGRGGQAVVHLAEDTRLPRNVALKVFAAGLMPSEQFLARFRREAEAASRLDHPGICTVYEAGVDRDTPYIAMRYVEGRTLAEWIDASLAQAGDGKRTSSLELPMPPASPRGENPSVVMRVVALIEKTARALHAAHEAGLVHRDVKPGNVIVTREGEPVLLDFGLAREDDHGQTLTMTGALLGTPAYMSPEQLLAQRIRLDCRTDVYSLGVTLYECLTLKRPFDAPTREGLYQQILSSDADSPRRLNPQIPQELVVVLETAMAKNRDRRYRTALEFAEDLRRLREHEPIHARPTPPLVRLGRWMQRHPAMATAAVAVFTVLTLGLASTSYFLQRSREEQGLTEKALGERTAALAEAKEATQRAEAEMRAKAEALAAETAALRHARLLALTGASAMAEPADGMRALLLAREAVKLDPCPVAFDQLRSAVFHSLERVLMTGNAGTVTSAAFSPRGDLILTGLQESGTAALWDVTGRRVADLRGHKGPLCTTAFSPQGDRIVTSSEDRTARVWDLTGKQVALLAGHEARVNAAAFSPEGDRIVTSSHDGTARVWDLSGTELANLRGHAGWVMSAWFSPQGDRIVTASDDRTARVWDLSGKCLAVLSGHSARVNSARFSQRGDRIVTASNDATVRVWDAAGPEVTVLRGHTSDILGATFSQQGERVLAWSWDGTARVWSLTDGGVSVLGHAAPVIAAAFSPRGDRILTASGDRTARLWDLAGRELTVLRGHADGVCAVAFSPRGDQAVTGSGDGARVWDLAGREVASFRGHEGDVVAATFSPQGDRVLTASGDRTARLWDADGREIAALRGHEAPVCTAAFSPRGDRIVTASFDPTARVWDATGRCVAVLRGHTRAVSTAVISPQGDRVLTASADKAARIWDLDGHEVAKLEGHSLDLLGAAFSGQGDRIVSWSYDNTARVWDLAGKETAMLRGHRLGLRSSSFSPDGTTIVTASDDGTARLWDAAGNELVALTGHARLVWMASFSPQGDRILTCGDDGTARVWDLSGKELARLKGHDGTVWTAVFSPRGDRIATASSDGTARIWDAAGSQLSVLKGHAGAVRTAAFSPKGDLIVTASADGTAQTWLVRDEDVLALARSRTTRDFTRDERERYADLLGQDNADALAAYGVIDRLAPGTMDSVELAGRIEADATLGAAVRNAAVRLAAQRTDDPHAINEATWPIVKAPGRSGDEVRLAVRRLARAAALVPDDGDVINTFGVAQYRAGLYADALATLTRSDAINSKRKPPGIVEDVAFLAMCHHRLGQTAAARDCLVRLRELMKDAKRAAGPDAADILKETEALVGGD